MRICPLCEAGMKCISEGVYFCEDKDCLIVAYAGDKLYRITPDEDGCHRTGYIEMPDGVLMSFDTVEI